jgi:ABC-type spermidine/putrescine transport system permease subunit II
MSKIGSFRNKLHLSLSVGAVMALSAGEALAGGTTIGQASTQIVTQVKNVGTLTVAGAFLIGVVMVAGGLMKLKQASENQGQNPPYSAGLWRLALGAGLVALPALTTMLTSSSQIGDVSITKASGF